MLGQRHGRDDARRSSSPCGRGGTQTSHLQRWLGGHGLLLCPTVCVVPSYCRRTTVTGTAAVRQASAVEGSKTATAPAEREERRGEGDLIRSSAHPAAPAGEGDESPQQVVTGTDRRHSLDNAHQNASSTLLPAVSTDPVVAPTNSPPRAGRRTGSSHRRTRGATWNRRYLSELQSLSSDADRYLTTIEATIAALIETDLAIFARAEQSTKQCLSLAHATVVVHQAACWAAARQARAAGHACERKGTMEGADGHSPSSVPDPVVPSVPTTPPPVAEVEALSELLSHLSVGESVEIPLKRNGPPEQNVSSSSMRHAHPSEMKSSTAHAKQQQAAPSRGTISTNVRETAAGCVERASERGGVAAAGGAVTASTRRNVPLVSV